MAEGIFGGLRMAQEDEASAAIKVLFPHKDAFRRLQMLTEHNPRANVSLSILGLFRRMYKSDVLKIFQEEYNLNMIAMERKGRLEACEIVAANRLGKEGPEEEGPG